MKNLPYNEKFIRPEHVEIKAKGVKGSYRFLHISDVHVAVASDDASDADKALAEEQSKRWSLGEFTSTESFEEMLKYVRHIRPDALLIAGDAVDYFGDANADRMKERLKALKGRGDQYPVCLRQSRGGELQREYSRLPSLLLSLYRRNG